MFVILWFPVLCFHGFCLCASCAFSFKISVFFKICPFILHTEKEGGRETRGIGLVSGELEVEEDLVEVGGRETVTRHII